MIIKAKGGKIHSLERRVAGSPRWVGLPDRAVGKTSPTKGPRYYDWVWTHIGSDSHRPTAAAAAAADEPHRKDHTFAVTEIELVMS